MFASANRWPVTPLLAPKSGESSTKSHLSIFAQSSYGQEVSTDVITSSPSTIDTFPYNKTHAFFGSTRSTPALSANPLVHGPHRSLPSSESLSTDTASRHPKQRSLTEDFFNTSSSSTRSLPSPPPSIRSSRSQLSSRDVSPSERDLDLISRMFPSRGGSLRHRDHSPTHQRRFYDLESSDEEKVLPHPEHLPPTESESDKGSSGDFRKPSKIAAASSDPLVSSPTLDTILYMPKTMSRLKLTKSLGHGIFSNVWLATDVARNSAVAVKVAPRPKRDVNNTIARLTFEREAKVLSHLAHERILTVLSTALEYVASQPLFMVLEYVQGGDLLELVNDDDRYATMTEDIFRSIAGELIGVVGWLHNQGIVHRDVKLENVLLCNAYPTPLNAATPVIKLSDFGFARFIDPDSPLLSTRCGSEAYAAPELILGGRQASQIVSPTSATSTTSNSSARPRLRHRHTASGDSILELDGEGWYDGRETDAWAVGAVLYALICRSLPFGEGPDVPASAQKTSRGRSGSRIGASKDRQDIRDRVGGERERRTWLLRIAKGDWTWHDEEGSEDRWAGGKRLVEQLLVGSKRKRATLKDTWHHPWLRPNLSWADEMKLGSVNGLDTIDNLVWQEVN